MNCMLLNCMLRRSNLVCDYWDNSECVGKSKILNEIDIKKMN